MTDFFNRLPGLVAQLVEAHVMVAVLVVTLGFVAAWLTVFVTYQAHIRRGDRRRAADAATPGSFPGDNR